MARKKILILHTLKWQELTNETFMIEQVHRRIWIQGSVSRNPEWWREDLPALIRLTGTTQPEGVTLSAYTLWIYNYVTFWTVFKFIANTFEEFAKCSPQRNAFIRSVNLDIHIAFLSHSGSWSLGNFALKEVCPVLPYQPLKCARDHWCWRPLTSGSGKTWLLSFTEQQK